MNLQPAKKHESVTILLVPYDGYSAFPRAVDAILRETRLPFELIDYELEGHRVIAHFVHPDTFQLLIDVAPIRAGVNSVGRKPRVDFHYMRLVDTHIPKHFRDIRELDSLGGVGCSGKYGGRRGLRARWQSQRFWFRSCSVGRRWRLKGWSDIWI